MKPSGACSTALENKGLPALLAERCTLGCTETSDRVEMLARAVELVAAMKLPLEEATAVMARLLGNREP